MDEAVQDLTRQVAAHGFWVKDLFVFLAATALVVPLFQRARLGAVAGFLLIGVAVGPYGLDRLIGEHDVMRLLTIEDRARVEPFAELGVMFLLFMIGLELSMARLWSLRRYVFGVGLVQFAGTAVAIAAVATLFGAGGIVAVLLGLSLAMSSTAVVMQLLDESGRSDSGFGRIALSVLLFQDLMVAPVLLGIDMLSREGSTLAGGLAEAIVQAIGAFAAIALIGRFGLRPLFRYAARTGSRDLMMAMTVLIVIAMAAATGAGGLSTALGAFLAGILLGETEYRHQIEVDLAPFKGILLGLFFVTVGMSIDLAVIARHWVTIGAALAALIAIKTVLMFGAARLFGVSFAVSAESGLLLAQAGEFGFVAVSLGGSASLLPEPLAHSLTAVIGLSMLITPVGAAWATWVGRRLQAYDHGAEMPANDGGMSGHVVLGGYGRVGQAIAAMLAAEHIPFVALDTNGDLVTELRRGGSGVFFGDASRGEFLARAGAGRARAVVVTVNARRAAERMVAAARRQNPDATILARAIDRAHAERLMGLGAVAVVPETLETSLQLGGKLLEALGLPDEAIDSRLDDLRRRENAADRA
jgi:CPA2 family monovalent cation:H+ antiporter-2